MSEVMEEINKKIQRPNRSNLGFLERYTPGMIMKALQYTKTKREDLPSAASITKLYKQFTPGMYKSLASLALNDDYLQTIYSVIENEIFRKEIIWEPKFKVKCDICGWESDEDVENCEQCQEELERLQTIQEKGVKDVSKKIEQLQQKIEHNVLRVPNVARMKEWKEKLAHGVNEFNQSLETVFRETERNINIFDDGIILLLKKYYWDDKTGEIDWDSTEFKGLEAIDPIYFGFNIDEQSGRMADNYFCLNHRNDVFQPEDHGFTGFCKKCHMKLIKAFYYIDSIENDRSYYAYNEIIHFSRYNPSKTRGRSPLFSVFLLMMAKHGMDRKLKEWFWDEEYPDDLIAIMTSNRDGLGKIKEEMIDAATKGAPMIVGVDAPTNGSKGKFIERVNLRPYSIAELINTEAREEIRNSANRIYRIVPLFTADTAGTSALRGQGEQLVVLSRSIEGHQEQWHELVFPRILDCIGIDDYTWKLHPPEEDTEEFELQLMKDRVAIAQEMVNMGFTARIKDQKKMLFEFEGEGERQSQDFGGFNQQYDENMPEEDNEEDEELSLREQINQDANKVVDKSDELHKAFELKRYADMNINLTRKINAKIREGIRAKKRDAEIIKSIEKMPEWERFAKNMYPDEDIKKAIEKVDFRVERIVRDQRDKVAREDKVQKFEEEDPAGNWRYIWQGPPASNPRTTKYCKNIMKHIPQAGVSLKKLKQLIKRYGDPKTMDLESLSPHIQCRHTISRVV